MPTYTDLRDGSGLNGSGSESVNYDVDPGDSWTDASDAESQLSWDLSSDEQHDEESCEIVTDVLKRRILKSLSTVKAKSAYGSFAFSETLPYAVNPGLDINGIGAIGLPLSERDATTITKACHKAPFGKGGDTIVDPLVRNTWELNADQFELKNPAWGGFLQKVVEKTGKELGVAGGGRGIRAELYKLLLYEEGAMFKPHQDSEKAPRMFGTLVICLPSKHTGGEVLATHCGYTKTFETATSSQFGFSCVSWYADVTHEIKPVTSGYRFVLTYNLIHTVDGSFQSTSDLKDQNMRLGRSLTFWNTLIDKNYDVPVRLAFKLSHKYTQASLCLDNLKGHDLMRVNMLKDCCAEGKFFIYLANLERRRFGSCHEGYYPDVYPDDPDAEESIHGDFHKLQEVFDDDLTLNTVIDLSGSVIAEEICFEENDIMQANLFSEGPQEEDYSGFTGNEGVSATHWYRHTVAVLVPRDFRLSFLFEPATRGKLDAKVWLQNQLQEVQENPSDESVKKETLRLCELMLQNNQHIHSEKLKRAKENSTYFSEKKLFSDDVLAMVVKIAISLHRWSLLPKVLPALSDRLPPWIFNDIGKNLHVLSFPSQRGWLNEVIRSQKRLHDRHQALENLVSSFRSALTTEQGSTQLSILQAWQKEQSDDVLDTAEISGKADAQALFDIAALYGDKVMFQQILPIVKKHVSDMNFAVTFLLCLDISGQRHSLSKEVRETVFRDILSDIIPVFTLQDQAPSHKRSRFTYSASGLNSTLPRGADRPSESVSASDLVNLLEMCMILGLEGEIDQIFKRLKSEATTVDVSALGKIYIPLLGQLAEVIRKRQHPLTETYRDFYRHSVESYILRFVGIEPAYPVDWKRDRRGCGCWECKDLDTFLLNPAEPSAKFSTNLRRRNHLANRLGGTYNNKNYPMTTETAGSPHTLVVYKTDNEWKSAVSAWKKRFKTASLQLRAMHHETSKQLLGEKYEELFELRMVRLDRDTTSSAALGQE